MTNCISGCQGAARIMMMKVTKIDKSDAIPTATGDDGPQLTPRGLTRETVMWIGGRATMEMMRTQMRRKKHCKPMMD
jgi:hypothetical protein